MPGRYAGALFELAKEAGALEAVESDLGKFQAIFDASDDFQRLVKSPVFSADEQSRAISAILKNAEVGGLTTSFFGLIAKNRRLFAAPDMIKAFRSLAADSRGEVTAQVTSAAALSDEQIAGVKAALKAAIGKDVDLDSRVDPSILGGLVVKVGSRMIDSSLKTKLSTMKLGLQSQS